MFNKKKEGDERKQIWVILTANINTTAVGKDKSLLSDM